MAVQAEKLRTIGALAIPEIVTLVDDGASARRRALAVAAPLAHHFGVPLHVVAIHPPNASGARYSSLRISVDESLRWLAGRFGTAGFKIDARVVVGDRTACAICETYPDAVVVGGIEGPAPHGDGLPLIAPDLARHSAHGPVLVAGPRIVGEWRPGPIGVALDGSTLAEAALATAVRWANATNTGLEIVQVVPSPADRRPSAACSRYLRSVQRNLAMEGAVSSCRTIVDDDAATAIVRHLRDRNCALAVLATHGFGGRRDGVGRVAQRVIAASHCPVVLSRPFAADR